MLGNLSEAFMTWVPIPGRLPELAAVSFRTPSAPLLLRRGGCRGAGQTPPTTPGPGRPAVSWALTPRPQSLCFLPDRLVSGSTPTPAHWETSPSAARFSLMPSTILHLSCHLTKAPSPGGGEFTPPSPGTIQAGGKERSGGRRCPQRQYVVANYDNEFFQCQDASLAGVAMETNILSSWSPAPDSRGCDGGQARGGAGRQSGPCSPPRE